MILKCELAEPLFCAMAQPSRSYYLPARTTQGIVKQQSHEYIWKYIKLEVGELPVPTSKWRPSGPALLRPSRPSGAQAV